MEKKIATPIAIIVIVFCALFVGLAIVLSSMVLQEMFLEKGIIREKDSYFDKVISSIRREARECLGEDAPEIKFSSENQGFSWIEEDGEISFINNGYAFPYFPEEDGGNNCKERIVNYLEKNMEYSEENTDQHSLGFKSKEIRCLLSFQVGLACGDHTKSKTPEDYGEIYELLNPDKTPSLFVIIERKIEDFALARNLNYVAILRKDGETWKEIASQEDMWDCDIIFENEVPPSLVRNVCISREIEEEVWQYDETAEEWKKID